MPAPKTQKKRIPLFGKFDRRSGTTAYTSDVGQVYKNCLAFPHSQAGDKIDVVYLEKRPGFQRLLYHPDSSENRGLYVTPTGVVITISALGACNFDTVSVAAFPPNSDGYWIWSNGTIDASLNDVVGAVGRNSGAFYYDLRVATNNRSLSVTTTSGSPTLTSVSGTNWDSTNVKVGMHITGTGIPDNSYITALDFGANTITIGTDDETTVNATASGSITATYDVFQKILDADFDYGVNTGQVLSPLLFADGYAFYCSPEGKLYNSNYNDYQTWKVTSYIPTMLEKGRSVGMALYGNTIMVVGEWAIEFYQIVGNPQGSVLKRIPERTINYGVRRNIVHYGSWDAMNDKLIICDKNQIWLNQIGTKTFKPLLSPFESTEIARMFTNPYVKLFQWHGQDMIWIGDASDNTKATAWIYGIETGFLSEIDFTDFNVAQSPLDGTMYFAESSGSLTQKLYYWDPDTSIKFDDNTTGSATAVDMEIITGRLDFGTRSYKRIRRATIVGDMETTTCSVDIQWSDDDSQNFNTARTVDMADLDPTITELGALRRPVFRIRSNNTVHTRFEGIEFEYEELAR